MIDIYFPYVAGLSCSFAILAYVYKFIRVHRRVQVNCWFCNCNFKVDYKFSNAFICPFCEQYNGFREDGHYNCVIPAQHSESFNSPLKQSIQKISTKDKTKFDNGFCEACNLNQALKIRALAEFSSVSSDDNDEVEKFRERLEEIYGLCQQCQGILNQTLGKQNSWLNPLLISWKLFQSKEKVLNVKILKNGNSFLWKISRTLLLIVCLTLSVLSLEKYLPERLLPFKSSFDRGNIYSQLFNTGILLQICFCAFFQEKFLNIRNVASFSGWIFVLVSKKLNFFGASGYSFVQFFLHTSNCWFIAWITRRKKDPAFDSTNETKKIRPMKMGHDASFCSSSLQGSDSPLNNSFATADEKVEDLTQGVVQKDLDADLLSLKISTPKKDIRSRDALFSPQNLFRDNPTKKNKATYDGVLQPSKFGKPFITQSSWVAGGYWGSPGSPQRSKLTRQNVSHLEEKPQPVFSLSRSSSQSSGFVSQFSECPSSKSHPNAFPNLPKKMSLSQQGSLTGDNFERGSIYSFGFGTHANAPACFSSLKQQNLEKYEAQSACSASASSYYSDNSRLHHRPSTQSGSCFHDTSKITDILPLDRFECVSSSSNRSNLYFNYFNLGIAFVLGLSVSANLFLAFIVWHYIIVK